MSVGPPAECIYISARPHVAEGVGGRDEAKRDVGSARVFAASATASRHARGRLSASAPRIYARVQSCLRTRCVFDTVHAPFKRKGQREGGREGGKRGGRGERKSRGELSSSVSHMAGHDDPRRKFLSS